MTVSLTDLQALPAPTLLQPVDSAAAKRTRIARVVALLRAAGIDYDVGGTDDGSTIIEADTVPVVEEAGAFRDVLQAQTINEVALQLLVAFAKGANLDQLGARVSTPRKPLVASPRPFSTNPEDWEADDDYRPRVANALERPSTAGSKAGYREHARRIAGVKDVAVVRPGPPRVLIYVLGTNGAPPVEVLAAVRDLLSAEDVRPQNDDPEIYAAGVITVDVVGTYTLYPGATAATCKALGDERIAAYIDGHFALGHDITLDGVKAAALVPGVKGFAVTLNGQAADLVLDGTQAPRRGSIVTDIADTRDA